MSSMWERKVPVGLFTRPQSQREDVVQNQRVLSIVEANAPGPLIRLEPKPHPVMRSLGLPPSTTLFKNALETVIRL